MTVDPVRHLRLARQRIGRQSSRRGRGSPAGPVTGGRRSESPRPAERGSGSVLAVGILMALSIVLAGGLALASAELASHRARVAADLGSLAGAELVMRGEGTDAACGWAAEVAHRNGATLTHCTVVPGDALEVTAVVHAATRVVGDAVARARAGPP